jgi:hypothetical protein
MTTSRIGHRWRPALPFLTVVLVACGNPAASSTPSSETSAQPSGSSAERCPWIDLRTPAGDTIDLNGAWVTEKEGTRGGIYYFRQVGSCFWFVGGFPGDDDEAVEIAGELGFVTVAFHGRLSEDFGISGEWVDIRDQFRDQPGLGGTMDLKIVVDDAGVVHVEYLGGSGEPFIEPGVREEQSWIQVSETGEYPPESTAGP